MANEKPRVPQQHASTDEPQGAGAQRADNIIVPRHVRAQMQREQEAQNQAGQAAQQKPPVTLADLQKQPQGGDEAAVRRGTDAANNQP